VHGGQGGGKNVIFETVMAIYGNYGRILEQDALIDKHNDWASRKLFLIADEVVAQAHRFEHKNKLKTLITGAQIRINPKHIAAYDEANHVNLVFLSNESMPVVLEEDDRRHCVIWTPPAKPETYYAALAAEINSGGIEALHDYLLHLDLGDFSPHSKPPDSAAKRELIGLAQDSPVEFVDSLLMGDLPHLVVNNDDDPNDGCPIPGLSTDWFQAYCRWCSTVGVKPASHKRFVNALEKKRAIRAVRKRYDDRSDQNTVPKRTNPRWVFLFGLTAPEGADECEWLGGQVQALKNRLSDQRGRIE
jgi:putative DNA primase/helicase